MIRIFNRLERLYPKFYPFNASNVNEAVDEWQRCLPYRHDILDLAITEIGRKNKNFPKVAEIAEACDAIIDKQRLEDQKRYSNTPNPFNIPPELINDFIYKKGERVPFNRCCYRDENGYRCNETASIHVRDNRDYYCVFHLRDQLILNDPNWEKDRIGNITGFISKMNK